MILCQSSVLERQDARAIYHIPKSWERKGMLIVSSTTRDVDLAGLSSDSASYNYRTEYRETCIVPEAWFGAIVDSSLLRYINR